MTLSWLFLAVSARLSMKIWKPALFYDVLCMWMCVCLSLYVCVCVCVHSIWPLNCSLNRIRRLCFLPTTRTGALSLLFILALLSLSPPAPLSLSLSASLEYWSSWSSSCSSCSSRLVLSMHSSTFSSCQRQRSWATFSGLAVLNLVLLLLPPHRSYFLHPTPPCLPYTFAGRAGRSCGTHFSQFLPSTRSISTSFRMPHLLLVLFPSLSLSLSASWLLACVSLCLFWKSP